MHKLELRIIEAYTSHHNASETPDVSRHSDSELLSGQLVALAKGFQATVENSTRSKDVTPKFANLYGGGFVTETTCIVSICVGGAVAIAFIQAARDVILAWIKPGRTVAVGEGQTTTPIENASDLEAVFERERSLLDHLMPPFSAEGPMEPKTRVDIALITVIRSEAVALRAALGDMAHVRPTAQVPRNLYAWESGVVKSPHYDTPYTVVTAYLGGPGSTSGYAGTLKTIEAWEPRYVILLGIAGGLKPSLKRGDVVVSNEIYGYEYGKIDGGKFTPRPNQTLQGNHSLIRNAEMHPTRVKDWHAPLRSMRQGWVPSVECGPIASGEKVVDDPTAEFFKEVRSLWRDKLIAVEMEGVGAAKAEQDARESGYDVGFLMIRGISDLPPREGAEPPGHQTAERDDWAPLAASAAAHFAISFIKESWPVPPRNEIESQTRPLG